MHMALFAAEENRRPADKGKISRPADKTVETHHVVPRKHPRQAAECGLESALQATGTARATLSTTGSLDIVRWILRIGAWW